jgi:hypothetical protein
MSADFDPTETVYVKNELGMVHSVTRAHYEHYLTQQSQDTGKRYPLPGWALVTEKEAREANPQLFGEWDDRIVFTDDEIARAVQREEAIKKFRRGQGVARSRGTKPADDDPEA